MYFSLFDPKRTEPLRLEDWASAASPDAERAIGDWEADAQLYLADQQVAEAVNVAIALGKPLLVTGEPGVGKSQLAYAVAWQLGLGKPLKFVAKSTAREKDLFYQYDALARFHAIEVARHVSNVVASSDKPATPDQMRDMDLPSDPFNFIEYTALGEAILRAHPSEDVAEFLHDGKMNGTPHPGTPARSMVLIDEIDKASSDFCNDLLDEIDQMTFRVPELKDAETPRLAVQNRPVVIITSNKERELPPAFLRRCVYANIPFPPNMPGNQGNPLDYTIQNILTRREVGDDVWSPLVASVIEMVEVLRRPNRLQKAPGTAELIEAIAILVRLEADLSRSIREQSEHMSKVLSTLVKTPEDLAVAHKLPMCQPHDMTQV